VYVSVVSKNCIRAAVVVWRW